MWDMVAEALPEDYDIGTHFTPHYPPWKERLCMLPEGDLLKAIASAKASMVTDRIECFVEDGIRLKSGQTLKADIVVCATGIELSGLGNIEFTIDGNPVCIPDRWTYKGIMLSDMPNLAWIFGYIRSSWTLRSDLIARFVCRLLNHMTQHGLRQCTPTLTDASMPLEPWSDFSSGYIQRAAHLFPKRGTRPPWKLKQNYVHDLMTLRHGRVDDGAMVFSNPVPQPKLATAA